MDSIQREVARCRDAHDKLLRTAESLDEAGMARASLLPGWSIGHVLTHLARNADSITRRLEGAARAEIVPRYGSGDESRENEIESGAGRPAGVIIHDLLESNARFEHACHSMDAGAWQNTILAAGDERAPARTLLLARWREIEVHHVDLGLGYRPSNWPAEFIDEVLPQLVNGLAARADRRELTAWLMGRGVAPALAAWG